MRKQREGAPTPDQMKRAKGEGLSQMKGQYSKTQDDKVYKYTNRDDNNQEHQCGCSYI